MGRPVLSAREIFDMLTVVNTVGAYNSRAAYKDKEGNPNWVEWQGKHPDLARILRTAENPDNGS